MKKISIIILTIFTFLSCKSQQTMKDNCLSQENMRKVFFELKKFMLENGSVTYPFHSKKIFLEYDDLYLNYSLNPNYEPERYPHYNLESIEIGGYHLMYGDVKGNDTVKIYYYPELGCYPGRLTKKQRKKLPTPAQKPKEAEDFFCNVLSKINFTPNIISGKEAIEIAKKNSGRMDINWWHPKLKNHYWIVEGTIKLESVYHSLNYIVDANNGNIALKLDNTEDPEQQKKLKEFLQSVKKD